MSEGTRGARLDDAGTGAEVVLLHKPDRRAAMSGDDLALLEDKVRQIASERGAFRLDQFHHPAMSAPMRCIPVRKYGTRPAVTSRILRFCRHR
jgi:hypothetical protein